MNYQPITIQNCINKIYNNEIFLPAIQRKLVWKREKIATFFDSVIRGYPIGTFIWWKLNKKIMNAYPFYKFLNNFDESTENKNELIQSNIYKPNSYGVLDGQQRLNALFIGLTGTYKFKKRGKRKIDPDNYTEAKLFINLYKDEEFEKQSFNLYDIQFLSEETGLIFDETHLWVKIGAIFNSRTKTEIDELYISLLKLLKERKLRKECFKLKERKHDVLEKIRTISDSLNKSQVYFNSIDQNNIEKIVEIFQRINSGGLELTKGDLLFSRLVSEWPEGRKKFETAITEMKNSGINIDVDFIIRVCLTLSDLPVLYKENNFSDENVEIIKNNWKKIVDSLRIVGKLMQQLGFNKYNLRAKNSVIPILYFIFKGGDLKNKNTIKAIRKYLLISHAKNIFSAHGDSVLIKLRSELRNEKSWKLKSKQFNYNQIKKLKISKYKNYNIDRRYIKNELSEIRYGLEAFMILTFINPNIDYAKNDFHMDHIHPQNEFKDIKLKRIVRSVTKRNNWKRMSNLLPNLEILTAEQNLTKQGKSLVKWLNENTKQEKKIYIRDNHLPTNNSLYTLNEFEEFYKKRSQTIRKILYKQLL